MHSLLGCLGRLGFLCIARVLIIVLRVLRIFLFLSLDDNVKGGMLQSESLRVVSARKWRLANFGAQILAFHEAETPSVGALRASGG